MKIGFYVPLLACALNICHAATFVWNGGGADANWSTVANWSGGVVPVNNGTAAIVLAGTSQLSPNVDAAWDISSITFSNGAGAFVLGGSALNIRAGGITNNSPTGQTINNAITLGTNQTWSAISNTLTFNGIVNNGTNLLTIAGNFNSFITGVMSGAGGFTKTGTGTNFLSGTNTYTGVTTVSAGALNIQNSSALGSTSASATVASGATLQLQGGITVTNQGLTLNGTGVSALGALRSLTNNNAWNGTITLAAAATIGCDTNSLTLGAGGIVISNFLATFTVGGNITANGSIGNGTNGLTKTGVGTLTLTASNSFGGLTTVSAGVLNVQNSFALGGTNAGTTVASGAALQLQGGISVAGETLSLSGTGIATSGAFRNVSGSNSWSGVITLAATTTIDADAGTLYLGANITNAANTMTFTNTGTIILAGGLGSGTGGLTKIGTGTLILNGTNNFTGATTITGGTVQFGATGNLPVASAVTVNAVGALDLNSLNESLLSLAGAGSVTLGSGTLTVNNTAAATFSGVMSGAGSLVKTGGGTLTMSGVNTYFGGTTINAGAISIAADTGLGNASGTLTLNGGQLTTSATLTSARAITLGTSGGVISAGGTTLTFSGTISGPGALTQIGTKTLALNGINTYLGGTTNSAGTITVGSDAALGDAGGTFTFSAASTLTTTASFTSARNFVLKSGTATLSCGTGFTNTFNGVISGAGVFTKAGTGILLLNGSNTFTNLLNISAGTLRLGANERLSDLAPVLITATTAIFDLNGFNETIGSLASSSAGKVTLGNGFLTAGGNNLSTTNSAVISGNGGFTKAGNGSLIFTGANTYTSTTTIAVGTLQLGASERIANTSPLVISNGATFNMTWNATNYSETVASLAGAGNVTLGSGTLTTGNTSPANFSGSISGTGAFTKAGTGTQIFSGTNSYSGATTISLGNLQVNGSSPNSAVTIASTATLSGSGTVGTGAVNSGATNSPGASAPGTLASGAETWAGGGNYVWEINNATGAKGAGWDWLNISGSLNITATSGSKFNLKIVSLTPANATGSVTNFDNTVTYIWTLASAAGGIGGFNAANFNLIASGFQNPLGTGSFALSQSGNDLNLIFTTASPATVNNVQSGTFSSTGNGTNTIALGAAVNPTNAFLVFNTRHNSSAPGGSMMRGRIASSNSVEFVRVTTETSTMNVQWSVVEYSAGVKVQRGEINQTNTTINVPITAVSATNQAFVLWSKTPDPAETTFSDRDPVVGELMTASNLQFRVTSAPSSVPVISWQVVEFLNPASIGVQHGSVINMTGTNLSATATLSSPVDPNGTFLLTGYRTSGSGASIGARMLRAQLTNASTIIFDRSISGTPDDITEIAWQAVQLKDGSLVQSGSVNFTNGIAETNAILATSINTSRAIAFASVQPAGGQNTGRSPSTGNVLGVGSATLAMTSLSQLTLDRNNTSDQADIGWSVVGLGPSSILAPATGGTAISADTTSGAYTSLTGPVYSEIQSGNVGAGTIVLKAPAGFVFDTNTVQPTVLITRFNGSGANSLNINGVASGTSAAMTTVNASNLTFTVTSASSSGVTCSLTWQNLRIRPSAGTPLASGNLFDIGTAVIQGITTNSTSWGFLNEVVGAATKLAIATQPSSAVTAGVDFPQQPVVQIQDQFGNLRAADNTNVITATSSGTDTNDVNGSVTAVGGVAAFSGLDYLIAQTNTITFSAPGLTSKTSSNIVVNAAAASQVTVVTQPSAAATAGIKFVQQPVVQVQDAFGNLIKTDNSTVIATIDQGSGNLFGTQSIKAVNGVATFTNLSYQVAETITIDFTDGNLDIDTSTGTTVGAAPASQLVIQTQPSAGATAGGSFAQQPVIQVQDQFGNLCITNNSTVVTASRDVGSGSGVLQGGVNVTANGGVAAFANLSHNVATTISLDFNSGILTGTTSSSITINAATVTGLVFSTQPGAATVGSIFGILPVVVTQDVYGNNSTAGLASSVLVTVALTSGSGPLQGMTNLDIGNAAGNGIVTFVNLEIDSAGSKQLIVDASGLTSAVSSSFSVAQASQTITFGVLPNQTYGVAPFTVSASASSGLPVTFSIASGPATVASNLVSVTGAGTVTVSASQPGNSNYLAATTVNQSFTVTPAVLTVTAKNTNRIYGAANPVFTANDSGFVNGDTAAVVSGAPVFSTPAASISSVAGSPYSIAVTNGTLSATNYSFIFVGGQLTVTPANSALAVATSANPSPTGSNVTFTATVTAVSPGSGTPTGTLQFLADGTALGSPAALGGGMASVNTSSLSNGIHIITGQYAGDGNFFGSTNSLAPNQVINTAPVAGNVTLHRNPMLSVKILLSMLLTNASDADGNTLSLTVSSTSASNATVNLGGGWVFYTPLAGFTNADSFTYTVTDGYGGSATGTVTVAILINNTPSQNLTVANLGNGSTFIDFSGIAGRTYTIQSSANLQTPDWQLLGTARADSSGRFSFTDGPPTNSPPRFYRSTYP